MNISTLCDKIELQSYIRNRVLSFVENIDFQIIDKYQNDYYEYKKMKEARLHVREILGEDVDGTTAMQKAFSVNNPLIKVADMTTRTGKDIQQGLMELFTGSVRYIRNPHAHEKVCMDKIEAVHKLHLASLLMSEIDKAMK